MKMTIFISTYPDEKSISKIANQLVREKTVACVNISKISSIYSWKGNVENSSEYFAIFKTRQENRKILQQKLEETHPYDLPEIVEIDTTSVNKSYLDWIIESTN